MFPVRYVILVLCTTIGVATFLTRSNINIAIVSMVNHETNSSAKAADLCPNLEDPIEEDETVVGDFEWSPELQGSVLGCFFWTYFVCQAPSGYINGRFGGRWPIIASLGISTIITALGPVCAAVSVYLLIFSRCFMGIFQSAIFPGLFVIAIAWVPIKERSMAMAMNEIGAHIGTIILFFSSGFLVQKYTWSSMFYFPAIISGITFVVVVFFMRNRPEEHFLVSEKEIDYIRQNEDAKSVNEMELQENGINGSAMNTDDVSMCSYATESEPEVRYAVPWKKMLTNKAVLSLFLYKLTRNMIYHFINSKLPHYLKTVLKEDIVSIGIIYAVFTVVAFFAVLGSAKVSEMVSISYLLEDQ